MHSLVNLLKIIELHVSNRCILWYEKYTSLKSFKIKLLSMPPPSKEAVIYALCSHGKRASSSVWPNGLLQSLPAFSSGPFPNYIPTLPLLLQTQSAFSSLNTPGPCRSLLLCCFPVCGMPNPSSHLICS